MDRLDSISLYLLINEDGPSINQHSMTVDMSNIHKEGILPSTLQVRSVWRFSKITCHVQFDMMFDELSMPCARTTCQTVTEQAQVSLQNWPNLRKRPKRVRPRRQNAPSLQHRHVTRHNPILGRIRCQACSLTILDSLTYLSHNKWNATLWRGQILPHTIKPCFIMFHHISSCFIIFHRFIRFHHISSCFIIVHHVSS